MHESGGMSTEVASPHFRAQVDEHLYLKDPTSSDLGERIVEHGILMLDEIGLEEFTFRKLAQRIDTTEAGVYRYFRNKHRFLLYVTSWYWSWMEHRLHVATASATTAEERLRVAIETLTQPIIDDEATQNIDEGALYRVVVAESSKAYLHHDVDVANREGVFRSYKRLCRTVANLIVAVDPTYPYPVALVSTVVESSHMQKHFAEHLPSLTEVSHADADRSTTAFLTDLVFRTIGP